jgi:hypothetical protein
MVAENKMHPSRFFAVHRDDAPLQFMHYVTAWCHVANAASL